MTKQEMQTEALARARSGNSTRNDALVIESFAARGICPADIEPRVNVLTYKAWRALGRQVARGEHGVKVPTIITRTRGEGAEEQSVKIRRIATVFHITQTQAA